MKNPAVAVLAVLLLWAGPSAADVAPRSWSEVKFEHIDQFPPHELAEELGAPSAAAKPLIFEGEFRGGNFRARIYNWLTVPLVVTRYESRLRNRAYAVGLGEFTFAQDGGRIWDVLDVLVEQTEHYKPAERPTVLLFMLEAVAQSYRWTHRRYGAGSIELNRALRMCLDFYIWSGRLDEAVAGYGY